MVDCLLFSSQTCTSVLLEHGNKPCVQKQPRFENNTPLSCSVIHYAFIAFEREKQIEKQQHQIYRRVYLVSVC